MYKIVLSSQSKEFVNWLYKADRKYYERIGAAIDSLKQEPFQGKPLKLNLKGRFSLRVGIYRIIYSIENNILTINVLKIGHRRNVYN